MNKIIVLDTHTSNQIAAGEVVERPASVIKELVENAIDAGADSIEVRIKNGGLDFMIVQDNGTGITKEDLPLALMRYATSKLKKASDLSLGLVNSFGFRGEALPSIASVSNLTIISKTKEDNNGYEIGCQGGEILGIKPAAGAYGTRIEVRDLFFNVPARLKFIKSPKSENMAIDKLMRAFVFLYPQISWQFFSDDKQILVFKSSESDLTKRACSLLGQDVLGYLYPFSIIGNVVNLEGVVAAPMIKSRDSRNIHIFINNRLIYDKKLVGAIKVAFRTLLEVGQNPIMALKINVDPSMLDVNVHPRKTEVKFADEHRIISEIIKNLSDFLSKTPWLRPSEEVCLPKASFINQPKLEYKFLATKEPVLDIPSFSLEQKPLMPQDLYADLEILGQMHNLYILLQSSKGLILLDQHAAHERVMFEKIIKQKKNFKKIDLLLPIHIDLSYQELQLFQQHKDQLISLGFDCEFFGEQTIILTSVPYFINKQNSKDLVIDLLHEIDEWGQSRAHSDIFDHVCASLACHSSIRAGQKLHRDEINKLLIELDKIDFNAHCPHGRPIVKWFNTSEIKRWFHRP